jgi:hypothetical protein
MKTNLVAESAQDGKTVSRKILVSLRKDDSIVRIVAYLREIAKPGTKIVFFIRRAAGGFEKSGGLRGRMERKSDYLAERSQLSGPDSVENQRRLAKAKVLAACRPLRIGGVGVSVQMYSGSFKRALRDFLET